jgi:1,4-alpha-glucan branching enzyme
VKVLFVTREYPPFEVGGVAVHTFNLVKFLKKIGIHCQVLSFGNPQCSTDEVTFISPSSSVIRKSDSPASMDMKIPLDILKMNRVVTDLLKTEHYDVVHVEEPYVGAFIKHPHKVTTIHDTSYGEIKSILHQPATAPNVKRLIFYFVFGMYFEVMCLASSSFVIIPAEEVRDELLHVYRASETKLNLIRNGVELPNTLNIPDKSEAKKELGLKQGQLLIFTSAQHVPRKRLETLIQAIGLLKKEGFTGFTVVIGGDGPIHNQLLNLSAAQGLTDLISFPGWLTREKLGLYQRAADIFVLTSEYEAGPISLLEAMSRKTAVATSDIKGFPSLMRNEVDGLLFPVGDYHALSGCLKRLLGDAALRAKLSDSARLFAEKFDWDKSARQTAQIYKAML